MRYQNRLDGSESRSLFEESPTIYCVDRVPSLGEKVHALDQAFDIGEVQPRGRLVEDLQDTIHALQPYHQIR